MELSLLSATLALFAWVGFRARGGGDDLDDYVTARDSQGPGALGLSFFASGMGAWILFAPPEVGAFVGAVAVAGYAVAAAAPLAVFALLGRRLRELVPAGHGLTEFVRLRFGRVFHLHVVAISVLYMGVFITAELTAVGAVGAITGGVDPRLTIVAVTAVTLAYTTYGGLRASIRTDRWQSGLVLVLLAVGVGAAVASVDAPVAAVRDSGLLTVGEVGIEAAITLVIAVTAANLFHHGYWQRVFAARGVRSLARGAAVGAATTLPVVAVAGAMGIVAAAVGSDLGDPPAPFFALTAALPRSVQLATFVLGVALVASSVDTLENGLAALVVSERPGSQLRLARVLTVALAVPAVAVAWQGYSVLRLFLVADLFCAATIVPAVMGLWSRASDAGALSGAVAGLAGAVLPGWVSSGSFVEGVRLATFPGATPTLPPFLGAVVASAVVAVAVSSLRPGQVDLGRIGARVPAVAPRPATEADG